MRLVIVTPFYAPHIGGMEFALARIAVAIRARNVDAQVHTSELTPETAEFGVTRLGATLEQWAASIPVVVRSLDPKRDILLFASFGPGTADQQLSAAAEFRARGGKVIWRSPTADHAQRNLAGRAAEARAAFSCIVTNSFASAAFTSRVFPDIDIRFIPNLLLDKEVERAGALALEPRSVDFAWAGRTEPRKSPLAIAGMFNALVSNGYTAAVQAAPSFGRNDLFETFIKELDPRVEQLSPAPDIADQVERSSVFVHLSTREGSPNSVLEAVAKGQNVLASDIPECVELLKGVPGTTLTNKIGQSDRELLELLNSGRDPVLRAERNAIMTARHSEGLVVSRWNHLFSELGVSMWDDLDC
jgi:glycosyltransferase involved in cell wall biosynthesis